MPFDPSVFTNVRSKLDYDREAEEFMLRKIAAQKQAQGSDPAALQLANEYLAAKQSGDMERANAIEAFAKTQQKGVMQLPDGSYAPLQGMPQALGALEFGKESGSQQAKDIYEPNRAGAVEGAKLSQELYYADPITTARKTAENNAARDATRQSEFDTGAKTLPIIKELRVLNENSPSIPYAGKTQWARRLYPGTSEAESAVDLMRQARIDLAAPLAKQLGVNPTDKDFQASLDRIFDIEASKESRMKQIEALEGRILSRQMQLDPMSASQNAIEQFDQQYPGMVNPNRTMPLEKNTPKIAPTDAINELRRRGKI